MSVWLLPRARWFLGPGPRLFCRGGKTRGGKREAQRPRCGRCHGADLSTAEYSAGRMPSPSKSSTLRAAEAVVVRGPPGCPPELRGPWVLAIAGEPRGGNARRRETAVAPQ